MLVHSIFVLHGISVVSFPWKSIQGVKARKRVSFPFFVLGGGGGCVWRTAWNKTLTQLLVTSSRREVLLQRNIVFCVLVQCSGETVDHLLVHCFVACTLQSYIFSSFKIQWVLLTTIMDLYFGWQNWFGNHYSNIRNLFPLCNEIPL